MIHYSVQILNQLSALLESLNQGQYKSMLDLLSKNSIGKHTRHILEFYQCVFDGLDSGIINYDKRARTTLLETDKEFAQDTIQKIIIKIETNKADRVVFLQLCFSDNSELTEMQSSYFRELAYNIEHAVHHLAIIKIAVSTHFREVNLPENFGVAHSTQVYQKQKN